MSVLFRKIIVVSIILALMAFFTSCNSERKLEEFKTTEKPTASVLELEATEKPTASVLETESVEHIGKLEIITLEGLQLTEEEVPYRMKVFSKATEAIHNPIKIIEDNETDIKKKINFLYTIENEESIWIKQARKIETNENWAYTIEDISCIGDIETFGLNFINTTENKGTILYSICCKNKDMEYEAFFAIQFVV